VTVIRVRHAAAKWELMVIEGLFLPGFVLTMFLSGEVRFPTNSSFQFVVEWSGFNPTLWTARSEFATTRSNNKATS